MTNRQTKKVKKPLQTTLGKAPGQNEKEEMDVSHLKRPIETSIYTIQEIMNLLKNATEEVKEYITYECDIMFECRICRNIFRSLANFILHKRNYCRLKYKRLDTSCNGDILQDRVPPPEPPEDRTAVRGLVPVIEKLKEQQEVKQLTEELLVADLSAEKKSEDDVPHTILGSSVLLQNIVTNNAAVFQTVLSSDKPESMRNEVMELHGILESDKVVLGPDGKVCNFKTNQINAKPVIPPSRFSCSKCNGKFSTRKTLSFHLKNKHNDSRTVYVCPDCKETFANTWSVFRHLYKVHRKSSSQVKKLRDQISNNVIRKDQETQKKVQKKVTNTEKPDEENQWLNNIEGDNDLQMCGGCGKRFERKAALQSHATMCVKRIAVCNTIKENNAKKKEEESKDKAKRNKEEKSPSPEHVETQLKGASKRKPYLLRTYKQPSGSKVVSRRSSSVVSNESTCDKIVNCSISDEDKSKQSKNSDSARVVVKEMEVVLRKEDMLCSSANIMDSQLITSIGKDNRFELIQEEETSHRRESQKDLVDTYLQGDKNEIPKETDKPATSRAPRNRRFMDKSKATGTEKELVGEKEGSESGFSLLFRQINDKVTKKSIAADTIQNLSGVLSSQNLSMTSSEGSSSSSIELPNSDIDKNNRIEEIKEEPQFDPTPGGIIIVDYLSDKQIKEEDIEKIKSDEDGATFGFKSPPSTPQKNKKNSSPIGAIRIRSLTALRSLSKDSGSLAVLRSFSKDSESLDDDMPVLEPSVTPPKAPKGSKRIPQESRSPKAGRNSKKPKLLVGNRKRRATIDGEIVRKSIKRNNANVMVDEEGVSSEFMKKAAPYMDISTMTCKPCKLHYTSRDQLLDHMSNHFDWYQFQCRRCAFVSYTKTECCNHAKVKHGIQSSQLDNVVLWIPYWKSPLMSSSFHELRDEQMGGKHTNEVMVCSDDDVKIVENDETDPAKKVTDPIIYDSDPDMPVFDDSEESKPLITPFRSIDEIECIDITDEDQENFQLEVPQEMYTSHLFELVDLDDLRPAALREGAIERSNCATPVSLAGESEASDKSPSDTANLRPTRNRMRSIKTLQSDFFYDMGKTNRQSETVKTNGPLKQKKNGSSNIKKDK
ncbi:uncharacterized protein LOC114334531 isoform X2 [Diabrotica virgifera virgifera]|nr:uncharacterized protein LOC114334531 isoform X2 [Diabrotica virgifera virgifera]